MIDVYPYDLGGVMDVKLTAGLSQGYDDNITFIKDNPISDAAIKVSAGLDMEHKSEFQQFKCRANIGRETFIRYSKYNNTSEDFNAQFSREISKTAKINMTNDFIHADEPRSFEDQLGRIEGRYFYYLNKFFFEYAKELTSLLSVSAQYNNELYAVSRNDLSDSMLYGASLITSYAFNPTMDIICFGEFARRNFSLGSHAISGTAGVGVKKELSKTLLIEARAGADFIKSFDNTRYNKPMVSLVFTKEINSRNRINLAAMRRFSTNNYAQEIFKYWQPYMIIAHQFTSKLDCAFSVFYASGEYLVTEIKEELLSFAFDMSYRITPSWKTSITYTYSHAVSNDPGRQYLKNAVTSSFTFKF